MAQPAPRYNNVAQHLQKLPPETSTLSHKELGKVFLQETLAEAKTYFIVYLRLCSLDYRSPHPELTKLNFDAVRLRADHPNNRADYNSRRCLGEAEALWTIPSSKFLKLLMQQKRR
ncbi:unnamed protein product [Cyclocybe aegerita]|uniref:Uncharacterized protein n=1 Tax=Cyclocybe aegerita TaxID=1973307 RepID=A0A8S0W8M4_CYCAE|nr:unnamed protein product [Cyclocybe aegerita]